MSKDVEVRERFHIRRRRKHPPGQGFAVARWNREHGPGTKVVVDAKGVEQFKAITVGKAYMCKGQAATMIVSARGYAIAALNAVRIDSKEEKK